MLVQNFSYDADDTIQSWYHKYGTAKSITIES